MAFKGLTELNIFRGTYRECMDKPTRDMMIYLAWDTQEIFVGNSRGTKVKYGGAKDIEGSLENYFNDFKEEIYETIRSYAETAVGDSLDSFREEYSEAIQELKNDFQKEIDELDKTISGLVDTAVKNSLKETNEKISSMEKNIDTIVINLDSLSETVSDITNTIDTITKEYAERFETIEATHSEDIERIDGEISKLSESTNSDISKINDEILDMKNSIDDNSKSIGNLEENVSINSTNISNIETSLNTVSENTIKNTSDIENITMRVEELEQREPEDIEIDIKHITYMEGDELLETISGLEKTSDFIPTLCINTSTDSDKTYSRGTLYYYNPSSNRILAANSGGSGTIQKTKIATTLGLTLSGPLYVEINNEKLDISITATATNSANGSATNGDVVVKYDSTTISTFKNSDSANEVTSTNITLECDISSSKTHSFSATAPSKISTEDYEYTVNSASKSFVSYIPNIVKLNDTEILRQRGTINSVSFEASIGDIIEFYSVGTISGFSMGGFPVSSDNYVIESVSLDINGIACSYHKYKFTALKQAGTTTIVASY